MHQLASHPPNQLTVIIEVLSSRMVTGGQKTRNPTCQCSSCFGVTQPRHRIAPPPCTPSLPGSQQIYPPAHPVTHRDDGGVVDDEHVLDGDRGHLRDQDAAQRVGEGGVDADHVELAALGTQVVDFYAVSVSVSRA